VAFFFVAFLGPAATIVLSSITDLTSLESFAHPDHAPCGFPSETSCL
jgi:hypothetical protein